ncbi:hypothetical protein BU26DRAFT_527413 [Trematosphaeria pertusa]|uniref:Zn(2)-C6 fungal-type domain-containing protein n=1 Tax=Trematosphaeria pertusa TaxID=390896 RepID=A0A6A6J567_9PLEO|nr:uncharacterized protein BU26DRAFT_527413 [Trematosphaeria pertusa]KAF2257372.1 hypothetical protein BU26DRAFT_527413 [Trematosphaeria pertusa]
MAETITIPSPSLFFRSPDAGPPARMPVKKSARRPQPAPTDTPKPSESNGVTKRKQSKSRNGCITCKAKRLKCDETKPTCQQCARRSVTCGGYKKDFKWRPFEEASFTAKVPGKAKKSASAFMIRYRGSNSCQGSTPPTSVPVPPSDSPIEAYNLSRPIPSQNPLHNAYYPPPQPQLLMCAPPPVSSFVETSYPAMSNMYAMSQPSPYMLAPPPISPGDSFAPGSVESTNSAYESESVDTRPTKTTAPSSVTSGQSPRLVDLLLPGTDLNAPPEEYLTFRSQHEDFYQHSGFTPPAEPMDDDVEEIPRSFDSDAWVMRLPSPTPSNSTSSSSDSRDYPLFAQPQFSMASPEMLTRRFDRETCGILSVKDGPTENPWRTLVWPLARDCPALYHAIASMTAFHQSRDSPAMRIQGIDHMRTAVHALASSLENMRVDAAISTTLVLAFSESWDQHISTGINHIKGAKILINRALMRHNQSPVQGEDFTRLKFLCNSWIYIDVIARLTSADGDESNDFDTVYDSFNIDGQTDAQLDPLMGCASTLFPIIGRVANLVRKVRRSRSNSPTIISQAVELKRQLDDWMPPSYIEDPEDETTSPYDSIRTATAYQYATLLYLHQAVPEISSLSSADLAIKILRELATVNPRSRSIIVQIFPLMAAGCEVTTEDDREWVRTRWDMMYTRMKLGIIEKCLDVTKEVWSRRDAYAAESLLIDHERNAGISPVTPSLKRDFSCVSEDFEPDGDCRLFDPGMKRRAVDGVSVFDGPRPVPLQTEFGTGRRRSEFMGMEMLEHEFTVKGRLHWLGVMKDWNWEVLLG